MENYKKVQDYTTVATESAGTAEEKYQAITESLEAKINALTDTWDKMVNNMDQSGTFGVAIDAATGLVNVLNFVINDLGLLQNFVIPAGIIAGITAVTKKFIEWKDRIVSIKNELKDLNNLYASAANAVSDASVAGGTTRSGGKGILEIKRSVGEVQKAIKQLNSMDLNNFDLEFRKWADAVAPLSADIQALTLKTRGLTAEQTAQVLATNQMSAADTAAAMAKAGYSQKAIEASLNTAKLASGEQAATTAAVAYTAATNNAAISTQQLSAAASALSVLNTLDVSNFSNEMQKWADAVKDLDPDVQALTLSTRKLTAEQTAQILKTNGVAAADAAAALAKQGFSQKNIEAALNVSKLATGEEAASIAAGAYTAATTAATGATSRLQKVVAGFTAVWNSSPFVVISAAVMAFQLLAGFIDWVTDSVEELEEAAQEANSTFDSTVSVIEQLNADLETNGDRIDEILSKGKITYVEEEELEKLRDANEELNNQIQAKKIIAQTDAQKAVDATAKTMGSKEDYNNYKSDYDTTLDTTGQAGGLLVQVGDSAVAQLALFDSLQEGIEKNQKFIEEHAGDLSAEMQAQVATAQENVTNYNAVLDNLKESWKEYPDVMTEELEKVNTQLENYSQMETIGLGLSDKQEEDKEALEEYRDMIMQALDPEGFEELQWDKIIDTNGLKDTIDDLEQQLKDGEITTKEFEEAVNENITKVFNEINNNPELKGYLIDAGVDPAVFTDVQNFIDKVRSLTDTVETVQQSWNLSMAGIDDAVKNASTNLSNMSSKVSTLMSVQEQLNNTGYITADMFKQLTENDLLSYLSVTSNGLSVNTQMLDNESAAAVQAAEMSVKLAFAQDVQKLATEGVSDAEYYAAQNSVAMGENAGYAAQMMGQLSGSAITAAGAIEMYNQATGGASGTLIGKERQLQELVDVYNNSMAAISSVSMGLSTASHAASSGIGSVGDSAGGASKEVEDLTQKLQDLKQEMEDYRSDIEDLLDKTISMIKQELQDELDTVNDELDSYNEQLETINDQLDAIDDHYDDLADKENEAWEAFQDGIDDSVDRWTDFIDQRIEDIEDEQEYWEDYYDDQEEALQDELDDYQDKIDKEKELLDLKEREYQYEKELADHLDEVADLQDQLTALEFDNSVEGQKKKLELSQELSDAQEELDEFQHDHSVELSQDALDQEAERFEELQNDKIEAIQDEAELKQELFEQDIENWNDRQEAMENWFERKEELEEIAHNNRLQDIKDQRTEEKAQFDEQIANLNTLITQDELRQKELQAHIEDTLRIRQEAIDLIEGRSQDFYNRLIAWNKEYGTGVTVRTLYIVICIAKTTLICR